tara:strand:+ start:4232 stop:4960 length:729 start_codon:yes stop_codon:yes gene_type:complete
MSSLVEQSSLVNPQNAHFSNPGFASKVGAVTGCGGSTTSDLALQQKGMYKMVSTGGKKMRRSMKKNKKSGKNMKKSGKKMKRKSMKKHRRKTYRGGMGYGFSKDQSLASTSGVHGAHLASFNSYTGDQVKHPANMDAPTTNPTVGGMKRKSRKMRKSHKKKSLKRTKKVKRNRNGKHGKRQRGGYAQYMSNVANTPSYSVGAPPALSAGGSALASPPPITQTDNCMNSWKHLGDMPPYNEVF